MSTDEKIGLKLVGKNQKDIEVISAYLQDSIATVRDMVFLKQNRTFIMIVNRFMWENVEKEVFRQNKRIRCAVRFDETFKVKSQNINQKNKNKSLECLAIECSSIFDETYETKIFFSGGGIITINSEVIGVIMHDLGNPWNVKHIPKHKI